MTILAVRFNKLNRYVLCLRISQKTIATIMIPKIANFNPREPNFSKLEDTGGLGGCIK